MWIRTLIAVYLLLYDGQAKAHTDGDIGADAIGPWFDQLNSDMRVINQYTAFYAWELR